jgi:hypothetical protein
MLATTKKFALSGGLLAIILLTGFQSAKAENGSNYREIKPEPALKTASLFITPVKERLNDLITIDLVLEPGGEEVNAVETEIYFDSTQLEIVEINKEKTFCQLFVEENTSTPGKIKLSCLAPYPGTKEISNVYTIIFKQKNIGETWLTLSQDSQVLANDGYGTNILKEAKEQKIILE